MTNPSILIVEDEEDIIQLVTFSLIKEGYQVSCLSRGDEAETYVRSSLPDLVLLDLNLPGKNGLEICRALKADDKTSAIPVVMLTAKGEESDIITGFESGADDYVTKPFSPKVLAARIKSLLKRQDALPEDVDNTIISHHGIEIHPARRKVFVHGREVILTDTEFRILHFLARKPGWVFSRYQIVEAVRGSDYVVTDRAVDVVVVGLRKKLKPESDVIETVRAVGYRFKE